MLNIKKELMNEISLYCKANDISDINSFLNNLIEKAFTAEKYGAKPDFVREKKPVVYQPTKAEPEVVDEKPKDEIINKPAFKKAKLTDDYDVYDKF